MKSSIQQDVRRGVALGWGMWSLVWFFWLLGWPLGVLASFAFNVEFEVNAGLVYETFFGAQLTILGAVIIGAGATAIACLLVGVLLGGLTGVVRQVLPAWLGLSLMFGLSAAVVVGYTDGLIGALTGASLGPIFGVMIALIFQPET